MEVERAVEQPRAGDAGAVALERVAGAGLDALVAREPEVVVGAQHDARRSLHLHHRAGRGLQPPEVGDDPGLARRGEDLGPLVLAGLGEDVGDGAHVGWPAVSVQVRPVSSRRDKREFIELPFRLHSSSPHWVPPLRLQVRLFLTPSLNAFYRQGEVQLFLALRDGRTVGRISAHIDHAFNAFHGNRWGLFGFLELEDDPEVAAALFDAAQDWLAARGRDRMVGPMNFRMNDESGILIEGHDLDPVVGVALAAALLPAAVRGRGPGEGDRHLHVAGAHGRSQRDAAGAHPVRARARAQARDHHPAHVAPPPAARPRRVRRDLQRRVEAQLGLRALLQGRPRRLRPGAPAGLRPRLLHGGRERAGRAGRDGDHRSRRQPGAQGDGRAPAAAGLVALPAAAGA